MRNKKKLLFTLVSIPLVLILLLRIWPTGMGHTGIRPESHGCVGFTVQRKTVHKLLPDARIDFAGFTYYVNEQKMNEWKWDYCLGKDIWYGE